MASITLKSRKSKIDLRDVMGKQFVDIRIGALAPILKEQVPRMNDPGGVFQKCADAIVVLKVHGLLNHRDADILGQNLCLRIIKSMNFKNDS